MKTTAGIASGSNDRLVAGDRLDRHARLVRCLVRQHRLAGHVADGEDQGFSGAPLPVGLDEPFRVDLHMRGIEAGNLQLGRRLEAAEAKRRAKDKPGLALTLNNLGGVLLQAGDRDAARTAFSESLTLRREIGDRAGVASSLSNIGTVEYFDEHYDEAHSDYDEALAIFREIGDPRGTSLCLHNLSEIAIVRSDLNAAEGLCTEALEIRRSLQDPRGEAESLTTLGKINAGCRRPDAAREFYVAALEVLLRLENTIGIAECLEFAAAVLDDAVAAATVLGAVDGLLASTESARSWTNDGREPLVLSLRNQLGDETYEEATSVGQSMAADRAVALVVGTLQQAEPEALKA